VSGRKKLVIALVVAALAVVAGIVIIPSLKKPVKVRTLSLRKGDLRVTVTATTTSTIESERYVTVSARRMGIIRKLPVEEGDFVKKGQLLAGLDKDEALADKARAEATLELEKKRLAQVEAGVSMEKATTGAALKEAESVLWEAESRLVRYKMLFDKGMVSRQEYDQVKNSRDVAKARYDSAKAGLDMNTVKEKDVETARASVAQAQASLASVDVQLGYCTIDSPISGVVYKLPVEAGETVGVGTVIAELVDPDDIYVLSTIDEVDVGRLKLGMPVKIRVDALPGRLLDGKVTRISPIVSGSKQETRTFEVRVGFDEPIAFLKPGMSADIEVQSRNIKDVLHIPAQSVIEKDDKKYVYVVRDRRAKLIPIKVGYFSWSDAEITGGLAEGDVVVTTPDAAGLSDGVRVEPMPES
jgi:HlyD family secretion protein